MLLSGRSHWANRRFRATEPAYAKAKRWRRLALRIAACGSREIVCCELASDTWSDRPLQDVVYRAILAILAAVRP